MGAEKRYSATAKVTVIIADMNDNKPTFKMGNQRIEVPEDIKVPTTVTTLEANDPDEGRNGRVRFVSRTGTRWFHLTNDGRLSVASKLDREKQKEHVLVVIASDEGSIPLTSTATITITVTDVNDHSPRFIIPSSENRQVNITADYRSGSLVTRFVANDNDEGNNGLIKYRLKLKDSASLDSLPFFLNEDNGDLKVVGTLDPKHTTYTLFVEAYDQGIPQRTTLTMMTVRVLDGTRQPGLRPPRKGTYGGVVPNAVVMIVACMIIVVLIVLLFLLICIVYRRNKRHLGGDRSPTPTGMRDPPAYDAIAVTGHGMPPGNQLLLNSKLNSCGDTMSGDGPTKKEMEDDSASEVDQLLYENDDRNCNSECHKERVLDLSYPVATTRPQCLPAGHWRGLYNEDSPLRKADLKSADGSPLRKGSLTLGRTPMGPPGSEPYYHTLGQPGYTTPQHPANSPPSPYANLKRDRSNNYCEDFTLANQKALNMPTLQTPRANRALRYPYDDVTSV